ncbi:cytochrome c oxidase subunit II [Alphaproteobacteria bacterium 46_93_T64]|nr:cytochrome c oxidase subunit II [Alphaproteobacteria bacterium 46_93_T64]
MAIVKNIVALFTAFAVTALTMGSAVAAKGQAEPWQLGFQDAFSPVAHLQQDFHDTLMILITAITLFVLALMIYVAVRFNRKANPTPSKTSHNTMIEIVWTIAPILILIVIAVPSLKLLYYADRIEVADMTLKATGYQWYWGYEYIDEEELSFEAIMLEEDELKEGQPRLLATDNMIVLPVDTNIRLLITAEDVLHSWAMPAFGVKLDAVPGRINETWMRIEEEGVYYGQCSELCGARHGFMPIAVKAVSKEEYKKWLVKAKEEFAGLDAPAVNVAAASTVTQ